MTKVIDKYKRFVADEKEMSAYNERDTFLYGQSVMLQYEREAGKKEKKEQAGFSDKVKESEPVRDQDHRKHCISGKAS